jgi:peroxiredoxin
LRATQPDQAGVEITRFLSGSPAVKPKLMAGDVLLTMDDTPAETPTDEANWVRAQRSEETFPLTILRGGASRLVRTQLEGMPQFEDRLRLALVNRKAPEIMGVATFQGDASSLRELRGQVVVLEFWASYCGVCRFLAPRLDAWHRTYNPQGTEVVGITVDTPEIGRRVAARTGMSYTLASDPDSRISRAYLASQIPAVVVIDRRGVVRDAMVGYSEGRLRETEELIEKLLED